jgi:hypothetical protein
MQLPGRGVWGEPSDREQAIAVLRRAVELGINLLDTAETPTALVSPSDSLLKPSTPTPARVSWGFAITSVVSCL